MQRINCFPILITATHKYCISIFKKLNLLFFIIHIFTNTTKPQTSQWEFMGLADEEIYDIAVDDSGNVYVASWTGIFKSTDNGVSWEFKNNGLQIGDVYKLFIDYAGNIYLCGSANFPGYGLYKSTDGGENWVGFADTLNGGPINNFEDVTIIPNEPGGFIYVSNYYGVYRSADNGITWQSTNYSDRGARNIGINTNNFMFFANNTASWYGIYRSTDFGLTWDRQTLLGTLTIVYLRDGSILAGCYDPGLGESGIYKTTDNGNSWINTNTFSGISLPSDFTLDKNNDIYVSYAGFAVYLSTNFGNSWTNYGLSGLEYSVACLAIDSSGYIWAGSHLDGVYKTAGRTIPVELVAFTAEVNINNVLLSWVTASEINNQGFQVERRDTKDERSGDWNNIGYTNGKGTTTERQTYSYVDQNLSAGKYQYRLKQIDYDGTFEYSNTIEVEINLLSKFSLEQNFPNPFNPSTTISWQSSINGRQSIKLFNILGEEVDTIVNEYLEAGSHSKLYIVNSTLPSGVYFYKLAIGGNTQVRKMILTK